MRSRRRTWVQVQILNPPMKGPLDLYKPIVRHHIPLPSKPLHPSHYIHSKTPIEHLGVCTTWMHLSIAHAELLYEMHRLFTWSLEEILHPQLADLDTFEKEKERPYMGNSSSNLVDTHPLEFNLLDLLQMMLQRLPSNHFCSTSANPFEELQELILLFLVSQDCLESCQQYGSPHDVAVNIGLLPSNSLAANLEVPGIAQIFRKLDYLTFEGLDHVPLEGEKIVIIPQYRRGILVKTNDLYTDLLFELCPPLPWLHWDEGIEGFKGIVPEFTNKLSRTQLGQSFIGLNGDLKTVFKYMSVEVKATLKEHHPTSHVCLKRTIRARINLKVAACWSKLKGSSTRSAFPVHQIPLPNNALRVGNRAQSLEIDAEPEILGLGDWDDGSMSQVGTYSSDRRQKFKTWHHTSMAPPSSRTRGSVSRIGSLTKLFDDISLSCYPAVLGQDPRKRDREYDELRNHHYTKEYNGEEREQEQEQSLLNIRECRKRPRDTSSLDVPWKHPRSISPELHESESFEEIKVEHYQPQPFFINLDGSQIPQAQLRGGGNRRLRNQPWFKQMIRDSRYSESEQDLPLFEDESPVDLPSRSCSPAATEVLSPGSLTRSDYSDPPIEISTNHLGEDSPTHHNGPYMPRAQSSIPAGPFRESSPSHLRHCCYEEKHAAPHLHQSPITSSEQGIATENHNTDGEDDIADRFNEGFSPLSKAELNCYLGHTDFRNRPSSQTLKCFQSYDPEVAAGSCGAVENRASGTSKPASVSNAAIHGLTYAQTLQKSEPLRVAEVSLHKSTDTGAPQDCKPMWAAEITTQNLPDAETLTASMLPRSLSNVSLGDGVDNIIEGMEQGSTKVDHATQASNNRDISMCSSSDTHPCIHANIPSRISSQDVSMCDSSNTVDGDGSVLFILNDEPRHLKFTRMTAKRWQQLTDAEHTGKVQALGEGQILEIKMPLTPPPSRSTSNHQASSGVNVTVNLEFDRLPSNKVDATINQAVAQHNMITAAVLRRSSVAGTNERDLPGLKGLAITPLTTEEEFVVDAQIARRRRLFISSVGSQGMETGSSDFGSLDVMDRTPSTSEGSGMDVDEVREMEMLGGC